MSTAADRKAELELKKERLRALREEKFKREELRRQGLSGISNTSSSADLRDEADALLKNLGIDSIKEPSSSEMDTDLIGTSAEATR